MSRRGRELVDAVVVILLCLGSVYAIAEQILIGVEPGPWRGTCDGVSWHAVASADGVLVLDRDCPGFMGHAWTGKAKWELALPVFVRPGAPLLRESCAARLTVYNVAGREVFSGDVQEAPDSLVWDGKDNEGRRIADGWYYWRLGGRIGRTLIR